MFALGWVHDQVTLDKGKARELYEEIQSKYPNSEFSRLVARKLRAVNIAQNPETSKDQKQPKPSESASKEGKQKELLEEELDLEKILKVTDSKKEEKKKQKKKPIQ